MGREIRRVPPNWKHPKNDNGEYRRCIDKDYETAARLWESEFMQFMRGNHEAANYGCDHFWEWESPPDEDYCRPAFSEEPTWFQVYETVSEGTPVTPPFATEAELIDWLVNKGEMRGTQYEQRFSRRAAEQFIKAGSAPSLVVSSEHGVLSGIEAMGCAADD